MVIALIYLCLFMMAATLVVIFVFGAKNAASRSAGESKLPLIVFSIPAILAVVFYAVNSGNPQGAWTVGFIWATLVMTALVLGALIISGVKGLLN